MNILLLLIHQVQKLMLHCGNRGNIYHIIHAVLVFTSTWETVIKSQLIFWAVNVIAHIFVAAPQHLGGTATRTWLMTFLLSNPAIYITVFNPKMDKKRTIMVCFCDTVIPVFSVFLSLPCCLFPDMSNYFLPQNKSVS